MGTFDMRRQFFRQAAHHENQRIQGVNTVGAEPAARAERRWPAEFILMEGYFGMAPASPSRTGFRFHQGRKETPIMPPYRDKAACPRLFAQFPGFCRRFCDGFFDK